MKYLRTKGTRWAVTLALFGLFMQAFMPLAQAISIKDDDGLPRRMLICTLYGTKLIDTSTGKAVPDSGNSRNTCPVCLAFSIGATSLGGDVELPVLLSFGAMTCRRAAVATMLVKQSDDGHYTARAPPSTI